MKSVSEPIRAAQYVRMSREKQVYSPVNQKAAIAAYAAAHNFEIVKTYADEGRSGLRLKGRIALQEMLRDVLSGEAGFQAILVFDVSRWGRFQDTDESAHYEFLCRSAGVRVHYCAEMFANDGSLTSTVMKNVRRAMAGEFSRDLSAKVWAAQCRLVMLGYKMGGKAAFGLDRLLVDQHGTPKQILAPGEHKSIATDRVILVPGKAKEVATVRRIFRLAAKGATNPEIAKTLNDNRIAGPGGRPWSKHMVRQVLIAERYVGTNVYNRSSTKLGTTKVYNPRKEWIRREEAFEPIVSARIFNAAQRIKRSARNEYSDEQLLAHLRRVLAEHGRLSSALLDAAAPPASKTFTNRFGSLKNAYSRIDYDVRDRADPVSHSAVAFAKEAIEAVTSIGGRASLSPEGKLLRVDYGIIVAPRVANLRDGKDHRYWRVKLPPADDVDMVLASLQRNGQREHLYLFPASRFGRSRKIDVREGRNLMENYRLWSMEFLYEMILRTAANPTSLNHETRSALLLQDKNAVRIEFMDLPVEHRREDKPGEIG